MPHAVSPAVARDLQASRAPLVERTRLLCARDPLANAVRRALVKFERQRHADGWDQQRTPLLLRMDRHYSLNRVWIEVEENATDALHEQITGLAGHVGRGLRDHANIVELLRNGGVLPDQTLLPPWPEGDMVVPDDPQRVFYGYGLSDDAWFHPGGSTRADRKALDALQRAHAIDTLPDSADARAVRLVCRDDRKWECMRVRGAAPYVYSWTSQQEMGAQRGLIMNALSRMTNAAADNPVTIVPADVPPPA